jgi:hypothetical protein
MKRTLFTLLSLTLLASVGFAQTPPPPTKPKHLHGHDLKVRAVGEDNFSPNTPKVGVEFFHDTIANSLVAISDSGQLAVIPFPKIGDKKSADWLTAHDLRVRKSTEAQFSKDTQKFSVEGYLDTATGKALYISNQKSIAFGNVNKDQKAEGAPAFHHGLTLKVRGLKDTDFSKARAFGTEASKLGSTGDLVYITETGAIAISKAPSQEPGDNPKKPKFLHGLTLQSRKADEGDFTANTRTYSVEVLSDANSGATVYLCETGSLAAVNGVANIDTGKSVRWSHSFVLKARKPKEEFDKAAKYGVEVFVDQNTGCWVYICEIGALAVMTEK